MRRVLYVIPSLEGGGAEAQLVEHLRRLPRARVAPALALCRRVGPHLARVPADVPIHELGTPRRRWNAPHRVRALRRLVAAHGYEIVASFLWYSHLLSLLARHRARTVCFVRNDHRRIAAFPGAASWRERLEIRVARWLYRDADRVVFQSADTAAHTGRGLDAARVVLLGNGVDVASLRARAGEGPAPVWPAPGRRLLAVGRLHVAKGFDVLLRALARLRDDGVEASLLVLGEGPERDALERLAARLGIAGAVAMPGWTDNPWPAFAHADALVSSSRWEGFPNVVLEALALGTPVVATDCPGGPRHFVGDAGVIVPADDPAALAAALRDLDPALGARGPERAAPYAWDGLVERLCALYESL